MDIRLRALNRFGLGARWRERSELSDPRGWLRAQLDEPALAQVTPSAWADEPITLDRAGDVLGRLRDANRSRDQEAAAAVRQELRQLQGAEVAAMLTQRLSTQAPFVERLVSFWSNHLCVSAAAKPQVAALAGHYERHVVRPHVLGRFEDMVLASARHPAMLFYLDNFQSIGPRSRGGRGSARRGNARGLNENYARELLELHTVGVDGGYEQADVEQLARILTGWGVSGVGPGARANETLGFAFRAPVHEPGEKSVMGERYRERGVQEGEEVIRDLCRHPSTAAFVAEKLVRHFVSDDPPPASVRRIEAVFRESEGDLRVVADALIELDDAWDHEHRKFRTPQEWLVAVLRAFRAEETSERTGQVLRQLRHTPWAPSSPKGYGDTSSEWADPDSLMNRAELARSLARRVGSDRGGAGDRRTNGDRRGSGGLDPRMLLDVVDVDVGDPLHGLIADQSISVEERIALTIGGPAFQWR